MITKPVLHVWEYQTPSLPDGIELNFPVDDEQEKPPFEFTCKKCGAKAYLSQRFDSSTNSYLWPREDGCDAELAAIFEVMSS